jgi:hypothetical protein
MRRRHQVKSIMLSKSGKGLIVNTKEGSFALPLNENFAQRLEYYFPHLAPHFKGQAIEISDFFVGRYAYGISRDTFFGKTTVKHLA